MSVVTVGEDNERVKDSSMLNKRNVKRTASSEANHSTEVTSVKGSSVESGDERAKPKASNSEQLDQKQQIQSTKKMNGQLRVEEKTPAKSNKPKEAG